MDFTSSRRAPAVVHGSARPNERTWVDEPQDAARVLGSAIYSGRTWVGETQRAYSSRQDPAGIFGSASPSWQTLMCEPQLVFLGCENLAGIFGSAIINHAEYHPSCTDQLGFLLGMNNSLECN